METYPLGHGCVRGVSGCGQGGPSEDRKGYLWPVDALGLRCSLLTQDCQAEPSTRLLDPKPVLVANLALPFSPRIDYDGSRPVEFGGDILRVR